MATERRRRRTRAYVDGNVAYDYSRRSTVSEPEREQRREERRREEQRHVARSKVELRPADKVSISAVAGFVVVAMLAVGVLSSYVQLNGVYADTVKAQKSLTTLTEKADALQAEYEEVFDTETLKEAAAAAGNLGEPTASQRYYLQISDSDNAVTYQQEQQATGIAGVWQKICGFFGELRSYF